MPGKFIIVFAARPALSNLLQQSITGRQEARPLPTKLIVAERLSGACFCVDLGYGVRGEKVILLGYEANEEVSTFQWFQNVARDDGLGLGVQSSIASKLS